jgi:hypothetical protein
MRHHKFKKKAISIFSDSVIDSFTSDREVTMSNSNLSRAVSYCLWAALLLTVATSADTFAAPPDHAQGKGKPVAKKILQIESMGARAFGGTTVPMPDDPTNFQACDHGFTEWFIPPRAREHPMVLVHGSSTRGYQTTFDGQPGFQSILLGEKYPVYLVDLPWTGRAGKACSEYTWNPVNPGFSARFVFTNRVGLWPPNTPESEKEFFPGVAFSQDPDVLDQYFRNQYVEINTPMNVELESNALAVLLEELYEEHGKGAILHTHSSSISRGLLVARKTDKLAGQIGWEPSGAPVFPEGELPPPIPRADGVLVPAGTAIPLEEFLKLTKFPILIIWGDYIPTELDPANIGPLENRRVLVEQYRLFAEAINNHGGNVVAVKLPDVGVFGNTHYPYADTNINQVAAVVSQWLKEHGLDDGDHKGRHDRKHDDDDHKGRHDGSKHADDDHKGRHDGKHADDHKGRHGSKHAER